MSAVTSIKESKTVAESVKDNELAINNMVNAIKILNLKGYEARLAEGCTLTSFKPIYSIGFGNLISEMSFCDYPKGFKVVTMECRVYLSPTCLFKKDCSQNDFIEATTNLVQWAKELPKAVQLDFELFVPKGEDPEDFASIIEDEFQFTEYEIDADEEDDEYPPSLIYALYIDPRTYKTTRKRLKEFAKSEGVSFSEDLLKF